MDKDRTGQIAIRRLHHAFIAVFVALLLPAVSAEPARAGAPGALSRARIQCTWTDAYDSRVFSNIFDPGMAVIAAPTTQMRVAFLPAADGPVSSAVHVSGIRLPTNFSTVGGSVLIARAYPPEHVLVLPEAGGTYPIEWESRPGPDSPVERVTLTVLIPKSAKIQRGRINGYLVGNYPPGRGDLRTPERFVEVTADLMDLHLSSQFRIRDYVSSSRSAQQRDFFPKYMVVRYALIQKVEQLVRIIDLQPNFECKGVRILSGFRTPDYNRFVPEAAFHSYHQYGLAADIIVDSAPRDGQFDDINLDRKVDIQDAATLAKVCDILEERGAIAPGGIGLYEYRTGGRNYSSRFHIHVDVREKERTRWGYVFRNGRKFARLIWDRSK